MEPLPANQLAASQELLRLYKALPHTSTTRQPLDSLTRAQIQLESGGNPHAISPVGARGLMQLMPETAMWMATKLGMQNPNIHDPETNIKLGTEYMKYLREKFGRDDLALAAYNWGEGRLSRLMERRPGQDVLRFIPRVTRKYIKDVLTTRDTLAPPSLNPVEFPRGTPKL